MVCVPSSCWLAENFVVFFRKTLEICASNRLVSEFGRFGLRFPVVCFLSPLSRRASKASLWKIFFLGLCDDFLLFLELVWSLSFDALAFSSSVYPVAFRHTCCILSVFMRAYFRYKSFRLHVHALENMCLRIFLLIWRNLVLMST
jgi:hypothetical protein